MEYEFCLIVTEGDNIMMEIEFARLVSVAGLRFSLVHQVV